MDYISPEVVQELIEEYKEAFSIFNASRNGTISAEELERIMKICNYQPSRDEIDDILRTYSRSGKQLTFLEFVKLMVTNTRNYDQEETMRDVFLFFDRNGDGTLSAGELQFCLQQLDIPAERSEVEDLCNEFGGEIGFKDFMKVFGKFDYAVE